MNPLGFQERYLVLGVMGLVAVAILSGIKQNHRRKEMEHLERLKSLEMGVLPTASGLDWPAAAVCIAVGAGVPIGAFVVCWLASLTAGAPDAIWAAPVFVSFPAISASSKLAGRMIDPRSAGLKPASSRPVSGGKPALDPEAFDVVGRRG